MKTTTTTETETCLNLSCVSQVEEEAIAISSLSSRLNKLTSALNSKQVEWCNKQQQQQQQQQETMMMKSSPTKKKSQQYNKNTLISRIKMNPLLAQTAQRTRSRRKSLHHNQANHHFASWLSSSATSVILIVFITSTASFNRWLIQLVEAQCPVNTMTSFERIGGVTVKDSLLTLLYTAPNISSSTASGGSMIKNYPSSLGHLDLSRQLAAAAAAAAGGSTMNDIPITAECNNRCRRDNKCRAFLVDYARHTCYSIEQKPGSSSLMGISGGGSSLMHASPIPLIQTQERTAYFERICLNLPPIECERAWIYERVMAHQIQGHDDKTIEEVPSRLKCQEHCLNEREFRCRSGEYDYMSMVCKLSMIDRHIKPNSFRPTTSSIDYFENQCVQVGNQCDAFDRFEDMDLGRAEILRFANTSDQCQQLCTQIKAFICRSFTWNPITGKCYLNSANSFTVGGLDRLISAPGLTYYQRNDCIDLKLECDTNAMTLNLRTTEPFRGKMYVRDDPNACQTLGRSAMHSSLSIPFQSGARCATREMPSRYSSVVVVQQHPLIQRKTDRYIKVVCDFQTSNKTITSTYNVVANPWTSTALINATSFAPKIRLRITDRMGVDITGAKLGDELYLRIEAESESVYDMVARSVLAKSGTTEESIALIDKDGCPTDFRIFPPLKKLNRRTIVGKFDAFKFSSDVVVRFQVDVQFCLNQCPMTTCDHNLLLNSQPSQLVGGGGPETYSAAGVGAGGDTQSTISSSSSNNSPSILSSSGANDLMASSSSSSTLPSTSAPHVPFHTSHHHHQQQQQQHQHHAHTQRISSDTMKQPPGVNNHHHHNTSSTFSDAFLTQATVPATTASTQNEPIYYNSPVGPHHAYSSASGGNDPNSGHHLHHHHHHHHSGLNANQRPATMINGDTNSTSSSSFVNSHAHILDSLVPDPQVFDGGVNQQQPGPALNTRSVSPPASSSSSSSQSFKSASTAGAPVTPPLNAQGTPASTQPADSSKQRQRRDDEDELLDSHSPDHHYESSAATGSDNEETGGDMTTDSRRRRRRRSLTSDQQQQQQQTKHVPLQREIIVIESSQQKLEDNQIQSGGRSSSSSSSGGVTSTKSSSRSRARAKKAHSSGPVYDLNAANNNEQQQQQQQQQQVDNSSLLCTTRHSLVLATVAFCTVQFITIVLCLVTWMHKKDAKFKVKHPIEERLY